jgi:hypothetical protein
MLKILGVLTVAAAACMAGCGQSEVGTSPSSKKQATDYFAKEAEVESKTKGRFPAPQSIKKKVFSAGADKSQ